jgi:hypothetical protein
VSPIFIGPQSSSQPRSSTPGIAYRTPLLSGEQGTAQTIQTMRQLSPGRRLRSLRSQALLGRNLQSAVAEPMTPHCARSILNGLSKIWSGYEYRGMVIGRSSAVTRGHLSPIKGCLVN